MSQQTTLTNYFKSKSTPVPLSSSMSSNKVCKRRSLSLKKTSTPTKVARTTSEDVTLVKEETETIILSSDSDNEATPSKKQNEKVSKSTENLSTSLVTPVTLQSPNLSNDVSNSSATTIVYNLSPADILKQSPKTSSKLSQTPRSGKQFYSPTKKRILKNKSPAKRNLAKQFNENVAPENLHENTPSVQNFNDRDDKTAFLLSIIDNYLKTDNLKHLLEGNSQQLLEKCMHVVKPGMKLICRLYWRQHGWYHMEELGKIVTGKNEVLSSPDLYKMVNSLVEYGLITQGGTEGEELHFDDYVKLLKRPDLLQICKELKLKMQSKQDAVEALRNFSRLAPISNFYTGAVKNNHTRVIEILKSKTGPCFKLSQLARTTLYSLYVLMYLGIDYTIIREKKLELILINDKVKRETYPIDREMVVDDPSVVFQDSGEFYGYLQAHMIYEDYLEQIDTNKKCEIVKTSFNLYKGVKEEQMLRYKSFPIWLRRFTPPNIYIKILESGVQELKKLKTEELYKLAVEILDTLIGQIAFRQHKKAEWYAEKALILHSHLDSSEKAAKVLLEGFKSDISEESKDAMRPRAKRIAYQKNIDLKELLRVELQQYADKEAILENFLPADHIYKQPMDNFMQRGKLRFEAHTSEGRATYSAEEYCVYHYVQTGQFTHGQHWEGRITTTIYFLLFWDIIYTKPRGVTGIFLSHLQRYPLDMFSESFYINRRTLIDERLLFIQQCTEEQLLEVMKSKWDERPEYEISDIQRNIGWETLREVTSCLRPSGVAAICRRLATNYGYTRSGFPDLTLWNIHTKKIKFVEVKTDADKPSVKQLQWLHYLIENNIDAGFSYVGVDTTRSRARSSVASSQ